MSLMLGVVASSASAAPFELISTTVLSSTANEVIFSSIPSTYSHLQLRASLRTLRASSVDQVVMQLNGVSTLSYNSHDLRTGGSTPTSTYAGNIDRMYVAFSPDSSSVANNFGGTVIDFLDPFNTSKFKTIKILTGHYDATYPYVALGSGVWRSTDALSSIRLFSQSANNFAVGCRFSLYGIRG